MVWSYKLKADKLLFSLLSNNDSDIESFSEETKLFVIQTYTTYKLDTHDYHDNDCLRCEVTRIVHCTSNQHREKEAAMIRDFRVNVTCLFKEWNSM